MTTVEGRRGKSVVDEMPMFEVTQTYKRYQFFGVRTQEEMIRFVDAAEKK
jgi:hypothetical protein